ncbi:MAG: DEAD/DEAH box helicase [Nanoarchaeota archaeon]|nr:DEAD/DEAH box helicase [Nanoarchaeota archaeon]
MKTFEDLGLSKNILKILDKEEFIEPTEIQEKAIPLALAGRDIIGGSATGSGKTLVFASSIIEQLRPRGCTQALILAPTRELSEQVANSIKSFSKHKCFKTLSIYGGVNIQTQIRELRRADIVVGTPGRILDHLKRKTIKLNNVKILVLDEVDRMLDMGFYKDVLKIITQCPEERQTMLFSATISKTLDYLIKKHTQNPAKISVKSYIDSSKLNQIYFNVDSKLKFSLFVYLLQKEKSNRMMVFCSTRRNVDFITRNLEDQGIKAIAIHGGFSQEKRTNALAEFHKIGKILVCTDVAARGLDIKNVSHVYNYDLPQSSSEYIHRVGRTARAGKAGKAISILTKRDYGKFSKILEDDELKIKMEQLPQFEDISLKPKVINPKYKKRKEDSKAKEKKRSRKQKGKGIRFGKKREGRNRPSVRSRRRYRANVLPKKKVSRKRARGKLSRKGRKKR